MAIETQIPVQIHSRNNRDLPSTSGGLLQMEWSRPERMRNSLRTFGIFFGLTCGSALIPIAHYFLVPTLFITSFVMAMDKYSQEKSFEDGKGPCPKCEKEMKIQRSKYQKRITDTCGHCGEDVEILLA